MTDFKEELLELEENLKQRTPPKNGVVLYGSSSFRLWGLEVNKVLQRNDIANLAFGGSTLEACVNEFEQIVLPYEPKSMLFYGGDNDLANGKSADEVFEYFQAMIYKVRQAFPTIPFTYISVKPSPSRKHLLADFKKLNQLVFSEIQKFENTFFIDVFSAMMLNENKIDPSLFIEDELHLNNNGYSIWTEKINEVKEKVFHAL